MELFEETSDVASPAEEWVEVEPGLTWIVLQERLRQKGMGPTVYPTSAPRSTVGGWLAENGVGVGSYEYGWLLQNVLSVEAVLAGGKRDHIEGEALRHFVGSRGSMGFVVKARLATRRAAKDVPVGAIFREVKGLAEAILELYRGGVPLWHLGFLNAAMARAKGLEEGHVLFGAYPNERETQVEPTLQEAVKRRGGRLALREEADRIWEKRFFPADLLGPTPTPGRGFGGRSSKVPPCTFYGAKISRAALRSSDESMPWAAGWARTYPATALVYSFCRSDPDAAGVFRDHSP